MKIEPFENLTLSENQFKVLSALHADYDSWGEGPVSTFKSLESETGIEARLCRLACRALSRRGFAKHTVAVNQDYMPSGSGYVCTENGNEIMERAIDHAQAIEDSKSL